MKKNQRYNKKEKRFLFIFPILIIIGVGCVLTFSLLYKKSWTYNWTDIRKQIKDSTKIAEYSLISSGTSIYYSNRPKEFDRRLWIMKNATELELIKLTEYPNGTIKTIAYEGLMRKKKFDKKFDYILKAIDDVKYPVYVAETKMNISDYLIDFVLYIDKNSPPPPVGDRIDWGFTQTELMIILNKSKRIQSL